MKLTWNMLFLELSTMQRIVRQQHRQLYLQTIFRQSGAIWDISQNHNERSFARYHSYNLLFFPTYMHFPSFFPHVCHLPLSFFFFFLCFNQSTSTMLFLEKKKEQMTMLLCVCLSYYMKTFGTNSIILKNAVILENS